MREDERHFESGLYVLDGRLRSLESIRHAERANLSMLGDDADHVPTAPSSLQHEIEADRTSQLMYFHGRAVDENRMADVLEDRSGPRHRERQVGRQHRLT